MDVMKHKDRCGGGDVGVGQMWGSSSYPHPSAEMAASGALISMRGWRDRHLSAQKHWLLLHRAHIQFQEPTWWLTTICTSSTIWRGSDAFL